jgi:CMP-N-acetylneuraminic acid synthetase
VGDRKVRSILAIIPARGGSKGVPKKNLAKVLGKPLITYSIDVALSSKYIDRVVVSSDSEEILKVARKFKAETISRSRKLAQNNSPLDLVIKDVLVKLEKENYFPNLVVLLQPTSPTRSVETLDKSISEFIRRGKGFDSLIPLYKIGGKIGKISRGRYNPLNKPGKQRQELGTFYYKECGTVFIFRPEIIKKGKYYGDKIYPFIIKSKVEAVDIDDFSDLKLAEFYLKNNEKI